MLMTNILCIMKYFDLYAFGLDINFVFYLDVQGIRTIITFPMLGIELRGRNIYNSGKYWAREMANI